METKEAYRQISLLYYALLAGQVLFCAVVTYMVLDSGLSQGGWPEGPLGIVAPLLIIGLLPLVSSVNRNQLSSAPRDGDLGEKVGHYRRLVILRSALIEGANLFCVVLLLLENSTTFLIFFAAGLLVFLYFRPSADEFQQHYALSSAEKASLNLS